VLVNGVNFGKSSPWVIDGGFVYWILAYFSDDVHPPRASRDEIREFAILRREFAQETIPAFGLFRQCIFGINLREGLYDWDCCHDFNA
jgi:hypothetical protein